MTTELIDRYVYEVGRRLPQKQREDIEKELKSLLLDSLEARTSGRAPTDEDVAAVLKEFGEPGDVAARYTGERYVVGPRLYPIYRMVLCIVLGAFALGIFISTFVVAVFQPSSGQDFGRLLLQFLGNLFSGAWGAIGVVTVIFWGVERGLARQGAKLPDGSTAWDPKKLPPVPKHQERWKPADSIASIVFTAIALVLFNLYPNVIAVYSQNAAGQWASVPVISPEALAAFLPLWNISWALSIALHAVLLAQGRWKPGTNLANIGLQLFNIAVAAVMMAGPILLNPAITISGDAGAVEAFSNVYSIFRQNFFWIYALAMFGSIVEIGRTIYRLAKGRE